MRLYLTKNNSKTVDFVLFVSDDKFVRKSAGKVGKSGIANSTLNAGTPDKAIEEIDRQARELKDKGFIETDLPNNLITKDIVFDKAKWHITDDFPKDLDQHQSYVHTGLFVCWLVDSGLIEDDFRNENQIGINLLLSRQITPSQFYADYLDGVFDAAGLTQEAIKFTTDYFDFKKGKYVADYLATLDPDDCLPSIFHIADSWSNYDKLKKTIHTSYVLWRQTDRKE